MIYATLSLALAVIFLGLMIERASVFIVNAITDVTRQRAQECFRARRPMGVDR